MGRGWADIYTYKVLNSKSAMKKILLQLALLLVTFAANAELTEWKNIVSTNFVTSISHDSKYINVATNGGGLIRVNKQTGEQTYYSRSEYGIPDNSIMNAVPHNSELWLCNHYYGLAKMDDKGIKPIDISGTMTNQYVTSIAFEDNEQWLLGGMHNLYRFKDGKLSDAYPFYNPLSPFSYVSDIQICDNMCTYVSWYNAWNEDIGFFILTNDGLEPVRSANDNKTCGSTYKMAIDEHNNVWLATANDGLVKYDGKFFTYFDMENSDIPTNSITDVKIDDGGNVWGVGGNFLFQYDGHVFHKIIYDSNYTNDYLLSLDVDGEDVYVGSRYQGLLKLNNERLSVIPLEANSIQTNTLTGSGCVDEKGNFWGGCLEGLVTYNLHTKETHIKHYPQIHETIMDNDGSAWIQWNIGDTAYIKISGKESTVILRDNLPFGKSYISQTKFDRQNNMWIATANGIYCHDGTSWIRFDKSNTALQTNNVNCMDFDSKGHLWCGTYGGGLYKYDGKKWIRYNTPSDYIGAIAIDKNDAVWLNCRDSEYPDEMTPEKGYGLTCINGDKTTTYNLSNSPIKGNFISDIKIDDNNNKWLALGGNIGITSFDGTTWKDYNVENSGIAHNEVLKLIIDKKNDLLWMVHYTGNAMSVAKLNCGTTGISLPHRNAGPRNGVAYDLQGRTTPSNYWGIYIYNGKKYIGTPNK